MDSQDRPSVTKSGKKTYVSPRLVRLGSVRDLTFGPSGPHPDGSLGSKGK